MKSAPQIGTICTRKLPMIFKLFLSSLSLPYLLSRNTRVCTIIIVSVDSRNFEMWGQFPPPMSEKCGGLVNKNGNLYLRQ